MVLRTCPFPKSGEVRSFPSFGERHLCVPGKMELLKAQSLGRLIGLFDGPWRRKVTFQKDLCLLPW